MRRVLDILFLAAGLLWARPVVAVTINTVPVGNPGNIADTEIMINDGTTGYGSVSYNYRIGTFEVTNSQYAEFLNAKAASDPLALYNTTMGIDPRGGIARSGSSGSFTYAVIAGRGDKPVNYVFWYDAFRFANWLHNGQGSGDTETGAYTLLGGTPEPSNSLSITRNAGAIWFLTSEDEWYKAAYHKNDGVTGNYFDYPTSSDTAPVAEVPPGGSNSANNGFSTVSDLTDVGAYTASDSPYGTFDQGGNATEWHEAVVFTGFFRGLRGGAWSGGFMDASVRSFGTGEANGIGFRVATIPEPSTGVLAAMGLVCLAIAGWRRKR